MRHGEWSWLIQRARGLERLAAAGDGEGCRAQLLSLSYEFERLYDEQALAFLRALDTPAATQADEGAMRRAQRALCRAVRTVLDLPAGAAARQVLSPAVVALAQSWRPPGEKAAALEEKEQRLLALGGREDGDFARLTALRGQLAAALGYQSLRDWADRETYGRVRADETRRQLAALAPALRALLERLRGQYTPFFARRVKARPLPPEEALFRLEGALSGCGELPRLLSYLRVSPYADLSPARGHYSFTQPLPGRRDAILRHTAAGDEGDLWVLLHEAGHYAALHPLLHENPCALWFFEPCRPDLAEWQAMSVEVMAAKRYRWLYGPLRARPMRRHLVYTLLHQAAAGLAWDEFEGLCPDEQTTAGRRERWREVCAKWGLHGAMTRPDGYLSVDALWRQPGYGLSYGIGGLSALGLGLRPGGWQKLEQLLALPLLTPVDEGREKLALPAYEQTLRLLERGLEKDGDPLAT